MFKAAKAKNDNLSPKKRETLFKIYKKLKYGEEEEEVKSTAVDPVNEHIMKKNYTHKFKISKLEKMKLMMDHRKRQEKLNNLLKEKEKEVVNNTKVNGEVNDKKEEVIEELIQVDEDEHSSDEENEDIEIEESGDEYDFEDEEENDEVEEIEDEFEDDIIHEDDYSEKMDEDSESEDNNVIYVPKNKNNNNQTFLGKKRAASNMVTPVNNCNSNVKKVCFKLNHNDYNGILN